MGLWRNPYSIKQGIYFSSASGVMAVSKFVQLPGKKVYYDASGHMVYGWQAIGGKRYHFDEKSGALL